MAKDQFRKYLWILNALYRSGGLSMDELNKRWQRSELNDSKEAIPKRTFMDCRRAVEQAFDINIGCNSLNGYKYFIEDVSDISDGDIRRWVLNSFAINGMIHESRKLRSRILLEENPSGDKRLVSIVEAMTNDLRLLVTYQAFYQDEPFQVLLEPYCVKVFRQRWYLLARDVKHDKLKIYALDRMKKVETTEETFEFPASFDAKSYFEDCFGVINQPDELDVETIEIKVGDEGNERNYLRMLPLHHSQQEVIKKEYSIFKYKLRPTEDFFQELLKHGDRIEVISPQWVRDEMIAYIRDMGKRYN